ncbi:hypothetical protein [Hymenobacter glacieicola]|uniref:hypothetical protein n=1 Tax=Hymenobacter glacieicola TaxID=1562124 RepID=UPI001E38D2C0|nr:hypothetical protein [Hymenobacter glacieicola]
MQSYSLASFTALVVGWAAMQLTAFALMLVDSQTSLFSDTRGALLLATVTWFTSLACNVICIQLPRKYIKLLALRINTISFGFLMGLYGLAMFTLSFSSIIFREASVSATTVTQVLMILSAINGFAFGISFHLLWKPTQTE